MKRYDAETIALIEEAQRTQRTGGQHRAEVLARLDGAAEKTKDHGLIGIADYYRADSCYARGDYEGYRTQLRRSVEHLLESDVRVMLGRAYNYVAIDAQNCGVYDVAYGYLMRALQISEDEDDLMLTGYVQLNLGRLFSETGYYDLAGEHLRDGNEKLNDKQNDPAFFRSIAVLKYLTGMNCLNLNDLTGAKTSESELAGYLNNAPEELTAELTMMQRFLGARLALAEEKTDVLNETLHMLAADLREAGQVYDYLDDIEQLCVPLISEGYAEKAREILDVVTPRITGTSLYQAERRLLGINASCYDAEGNPEKALECLREQSVLLVKQREEQEKMYLYSIELADLVAHVRFEKERTKKENKRLEEQVMTDALTGVGNRYSLNRMIEEAFERAWEEQSVLGIGIMDVDYFKKYNDTYGHQAGDRCLKGIGRILKQAAAREDVFCARYGGDEFVYICEGMDEAMLTRFAKEIEKETDAFFAAGKTADSSMRIRVSQGLCSGVPSSAHKLWDFLSQADHALYNIKRGRSGNEDAPRIMHMGLPEV